MVAIITGKGAGIENSSLSILGSTGQVGSAGFGGAQGSAYVNAATGNLVLTTNDEMLVGRGPDALVSRTYNSLGAWDGDNDDYWRASPYRRVHSYVAGTSVKRTDWDGSEVTYSWNANYLGTGQGAFVATDGQGAYDTLVLNGTTWTWTDGDTGVIETYNNSQSGRIEKRQDTSGNYLKYTYTGSLLTKVSAGGTGVADGSEYTLLVYGTGTAATQLQYLETHTTGPTATTTRVYYEYDTSDRLITVRVNLTPSDNSKTVTAGTVSSYNYVTAYTYDGASQRVASITQRTQIDGNEPVGGTNLQFTYDGSGRVASVTETIGGIASITAFAYDTTSVANRVVTKVTDANGQVTTLLSDLTGNLVSVTLPASGTGAPAPAMSFSYHPTDGDVLSITSAGNTVTYDYDAHGNRTLERDSLGNTITREYNIVYDAANAVIKNELVKETRYTVADSDGAGSGQPSGALVTRYTYDSASRLRFVIDATGLVTEHRYDSYGQRTRTLSYAGTYSGTPFDLTTLAGWTATATAIARTDTAYDFRGSVREVLSYSKLINGEFDTNSDRSRTLYVYNSHGDLIGKQTEGAGYGETYVYDGLGRVISTSEIRNENNLYNNASGANAANVDTFWSEANADVAPAGANSGNLPLKITSGTTSFAIASSYGTPIAVVAGDVLTFTVQLMAGSYDVASFGFFGGTSQLGSANDTSGVVLSGPGTLTRIAGVFQVSGLATDQVTTVTVTRRFTQAESVYSRVYVGSASGGAPASQSILFGNATVMRSTSKLVYSDTATGSTTQVMLANGLVQTSTYDLSGHLIAFAEGGAGVSTVTTNYLYDKLGRLRVVAEPTTSGTPAIQDAGRRRTYFFYDNDGRKIADIDADGSATEYRYDAAGRVVATIAYKTPVAASALTPGNTSGILDTNGVLRNVNFASIRPAADSANDRWNWTFYDLAGRVIRTIDGTGAVTVLDYDGASRLVSTTELANRMSSTDIAKLKAETPGSNLFTNATVQGFWSRANVTPTPADPIDGLNAFTEAATTSTLAYIQSWGQPQQMSAGEKLTFTITLKRGSVSAAIVEIRGGNTTFGSNNSEASYTISGSGTLSQQNGSYFVFTGLDDNPTVITITRTFTIGESATAGVYIGSNPSAVAAGDSVIVSNPILTRVATSLPALPGTSADDRVVRSLYDQAGRLIGTLDAEGYLTKIEYDGAGRKVRTLSYYNKPTNPADPLNSITADPAKDISNWLVYDARGMLRGTIDGEGTLTRLDYSPAGYLTKQERGQKPPGTFPFSTPPTFADLANATGTIYETTSWTRDYAGRALTETRTLTGSVTTTTSYSYDVAGNLVSMTTQSGGTDPRTYRKRYDVLGRLIAEMSGIGSATLPANPTEANLTTAFNAYGWTYSYDASDRLIAKTGPAGTAVGATGPRTLYYYNADGALAYEVDAAGQVAEYRYNSFGQRTDVIVYAKPITSDLAGMAGGSDLTQVTGGLVPDTARDSATQILSFFADGSVKEQKDALGNISSFTYNAFGELATSVSPLDTRTVQTTRNYDRRGLLKQEIVDSASGGKAITTSWDHDAFGRPVTLTDARLKPTKSNYDREGRLVSVEDALHNFTYYKYDARDNLVATIDARGKSTHHVYDLANRRVATIDAAGAVTTFRYDGDGRLIETIAYANTVAVPTQDEVTAVPTPAPDSAKDRATRFAYDKDGRLRFTFDALGHISETRYDVRGNAIRSIAYDYDFAPPVDGVYSESWFVGHVANAAVTALTTHRVSRTVYDAADRVVYSIDPTGMVTWITYDTKGQVTKQVRHSVLYTSTGDPGATDMLSWQGTQPVLAGAANDRTTRAWYDKKGQLNYSIDAEGYVTRYEYDKAGNVAKESRYADRPVPQQLTITDTTLLSAIDSYYTTNNVPARKTQFLYDSAGRLSETIDPAGTKTRLVLDALGQVTTSTHAADTTDASQTHFEYDDVGRMTKRTVQMGASPSAADLITRFEYDATGNLEVLTEAFGTSDAAVTRYTYDNLGQVKTEVRQMGASPSTADDLKVEYWYNSFGDVAQTRDALGNDSFSYFDRLGRMTLASDAEGYVTETSYTKFGELKSVTRRYLKGTGAALASPPSLQAHALDAVTSFEYDKLGRLTKSIAAEDGLVNGAVEYYYELYTLNAFGERIAVRNKLGGISTYEYDKRGLATRETLPTVAKTQGASGLIDVTNSFKYTAFGEVREKIEAEGAADEQRTTTYTYDDAGRLKRTTGTSVEVYSDTLTSGALSKSNQAYYAENTYDARGNLIQTVDAAGVTTYRYYDLANRQVAQIDAVGTLSVNTLDRRGNVVSSKVYGAAVAPTAPGGAPPVGGSQLRETSFEYDKADRLRFTRVAGLTTAESTGANAFAASTATIETALEYDKNGNVLRAIDGRGAILRSWYDKLGRKIAQVDQERYLTTWILDSEGNALSETRFATRIGTSTDVETATLATLVAAGGTSGNRITDFTYDRVGNRLSETRKNVLARTLLSNGALDSDATGLEDARIDYEYNGIGQVVKKLRAASASVPRDTVEYEYDNAGRLIKETGTSFVDYTGATVTPVTVYSYDGLNNLKSTRAKAGTANEADDHVTSYLYDHAGRMTSMTVADNPDGGTANAEKFTRTYGYDLSGRVVLESYSRKLPNDTVVEEGIYRRYDKAGREIVQTSARKNAGGNWVFTTSDTAGAPQFDAVRTAYNAYGEVTGRGLTAGWAGVNPVYQEVFEYDAGGRLWSSTSGDGLTRYFLYDKAGNQTLAIQRSGGTQALSFAAASNLVAALDGDGGANASVLQNAVTTITVYDKRGLAIFTREPDREFATVTMSGSPAVPVSSMTTGLIVRGKTYNAFGEVESEIDPRGYDGNGAAIATLNTYGVNTVVESYTIRFTYNTMGRLIAKEMPRVNVKDAYGVETTDYRPVEYYAYDVAGRMIAITDANGNTNTRTFLAGTGHDGAQAMVAREFRPQDIGAVFETRYDVFGNARILRNELYQYDAGTNTDNHVDSDVEQTFDRLGRLVSIKHRGGLLTDNYAYDGLGRRIKHWNSQLGNSAAITETTEYDVQGRVVAMTQMGGDRTEYRYSWEAGLVTTGLGTFGGWKKETINAANKTSTERQDYFGRLVDKIDFGGHDFNYTFDKAGQLQTRTSNAGENLSYTYHNTGLLATVATAYTDSTYSFGQTVVSTYRHDVAGNRVYEKYHASGTTIDWFNYPTLTSYGATTHQDATIVFDALNRVRLFNDTGPSKVRIEYDYDKRGNVRHVGGTYNAVDPQGTIAEGAMTYNHWYLYDSMNRFTTTKGELSSVGTLIKRGLSGVDITYDKAGRRTSARWTERVQNGEWIGDGEGGGTHLVYRNADRLEVYDYDASGYLKTVKIAIQDFDPVNSFQLAPLPTPTKRAEYERDAMGRVGTYTEFLDNGTTESFKRTATYNEKGQVTQDTVTTRRSTGLSTYDEFKTVTDYKYRLETTLGSGDWTGAYQGGAVTRTLATSTQRSNGTGAWSNTKIAETRNEYVWWDGALQSKITIDKDIGDTGNVLRISDFYYDGSGRVLSVKITDERNRTVSFINDGNSLVLQRDEADVHTDPQATEGDPRELHFYHMGQRIGDVSNNGTLNVNYVETLNDRNAPQQYGPFRDGSPTFIPNADFDQSYDALNGSNIDYGSTSYVVMAGDTLTSIAQSLWGDGSLWYLIAEANGLSGSEALAAGTTLVIPNKVHNFHNDTSTWRVYNPNDTLGDVSPTAVKPPKRGCGTMGLILMAVIAVAVSVWLGPEMIGFFQAAMSSTLGGAIVGGAVTGVVSSVASQTFGMVAGIQKGFNWKSVALAGIAGGISGGLSEIASMGADALAKAAESGTKLSTLAQVGRVLNIPGLGGAIRGVVSSALTQGIGKLTGLQKKFDWTGVAAAGVGGAITSGLDTIGALQNPGGQILTNMAGGIANAASRSVINGTSFGDNLVAALPDIIGQTIGSMMASSVAYDRAERSMARTELAELDDQDAAYEAKLNGRNAPLASDPHAVDPDRVRRYLRDRRAIIRQNALHPPTIDQRIAQSSRLLAKYSRFPEAVKGAAVNFSERPQYELSADTERTIPGETVSGTRQDPQYILPLPDQIAGKTGTFARNIAQYAADRPLIGYGIQTIDITYKLAGGPGKALISVAWDSLSGKVQDEAISYLSTGAKNGGYSEIEGEDVGSGYFTLGTIMFSGIKKGLSLFEGGKAPTVKAPEEADLPPEPPEVRLNETIGPPSNEPPLALPAPPSTAKGRRNSPGVASYDGTLPTIQTGQRWLRGSLDAEGRGVAGRVPGQVAEKLNGRHFKNFGEFRAAFWEEVANDPILRQQFTSRDRKLMARGQAPFAAKTQQHGRGRYEIDHNQPIERGGSVYDMHNLIIRTPLNHIKGKGF